MDQPDQPIMASLPPAPVRQASDSVLRQCWLNLRVWMPFLLNPTDRDRQVVYWARDSRDGLLWKVAFPKQCWRCSETAIGMIVSPLRHPDTHRRRPSSSRHENGAGWSGPFERPRDESASRFQA